MKSLMALLHWVLIDLGTRCGTSTTLDFKTVQRRVKAEGHSFLTIALANFGKDFQKSLDQGFVSDDQYMGFARTGGLPRFLSGFLRLVFDAESGRLLETPNVEAIYSVRQITLMWAKIALPSSPEREKDAYTKYLECEKEVRQADQHYFADHGRREAYSRIGRLLWTELFTELDGNVYYGEISPKHGPGATADKLKGNLKWTQQEWTARLERVAPHWEHLVPSPRYLDRVSAVTILEPKDERPSKVISVPKDARGPRLIAVEPTCMQYMQQAVLTKMVELIDGDNISRNLISSRSQKPNQRLAQLGSLTGNPVATHRDSVSVGVLPVKAGNESIGQPHHVGATGLATLDLSEASDRVSSQHVRDLLVNHPHLLEIVDASRTRKADVPGVGVIRLAKFASMGSALCFPFESIVFATVCFYGIEKSLSRPLTKKDIKSFVGRVRVYGDDIIVPVEHVQFVVEALETFGFRVNRNKSFWTGKFRESCGKDYYAGTDISVVRIRQPLPTDRTQVEQIVSTVSLRNQLFHADFQRAVDYLDDYIERIIPFPVVPWSEMEIDSPKSSPSEEENAFSTRSGKIIIQRSPALGKHSWGPCQGPYQLSRDLHKPMVRAAVVSAKSPSSVIDDYAALQKWFLMRGEHPFEDKDHLLRAGRPDSVRIKIRLVPLY